MRARPASSPRPRSRPWTPQTGALAASRADLAASHADLAAAHAEAGARGDPGRMGTPHPAFGMLSARQWHDVAALHVVRHLHQIHEMAG